LYQPSPAAVLDEVDQTIIPQWQSSGMFATVFLSVLDLKNQTLQYANAGHNPPMLQHASGITELLTKTSPALGLFDDLQKSETTITLAPGEPLCCIPTV
jgi:sigma-B regulation protein RsbU (phosphoserine phosphatase)